MRETRATRKYNKGQGSKGEAGIQKQHCYSGGTYVERSLQIRLRAAVKTAGSKGRPTEAPGQEQPGTPSGVTPIHTGHLLTTAPKPYSKEREREKKKPPPGDHHATLSTARPASEYPPFGKTARADRTRRPPERLRPVHAAARPRLRPSPREPARGTMPFLFTLREARRRSRGASGSLGEPRGGTRCRAGGGVGVLTPSGRYLRREETEALLHNENNTYVFYNVLI